MTPYDNTLRGPPFPWWWNFWWLGPVQIPPLPAWVGLTDRVTGTVYYLSLGADTQHLQLTTQVPVGPTRPFAPYDGPFVGQFGLRMGVSNGHIVVDQYPDMGAGPFARSFANNQDLAGLFAQARFTPSRWDHLAFLVGSAFNSVFENPHKFFLNTFPSGNTSDVLAP